MRLFFSLFFCLFPFFFGCLGAQNIEYCYPLKREVSLSGSYGELRSTHFHAGVDLRVGGVVGVPVYAAADGYISRVSVSERGYGNAIYITHSDGRVSLYGHLLEFEESVQKWVRQQQYNKKSFCIDLYPSPDQFVVSQGEFIGRAGNSGSSGGPHLHFELRDAESGIAENPLKVLSVDVEDNIRPYIENVSFYSFAVNRGVPVRRRLHSFSSAQRDIVQVTDTFYVAVSAYDRQENTWSKLAVYDYRYYLDDTLIFEFTVDGIHRWKGRYINSILEYPLKVEKRRSAVKSYVEPGCALTENITFRNGGLFVLKDDDIHKVSVEIEDEHGNLFRRYFSVRRANNGVVNRKQGGSKEKERALVVMPWYVANRYEREHYSITFPPGALYSTIEFEADTVNIKGERFYRIGDPAIPLHSFFYLAVKKKVPEELRNKVVFIKKKGEKNIAFPYVDVADSATCARLNSFGLYCISYDTIPPSVKAHFHNGANLSGRENISFTIADDLSGISKYKVEIDGVWVLAAYDPKSKSLVAELKDDVIRRGISHEMVIFVSDRKNNATIFKKNFIW